MTDELPEPDLPADEDAAQAAQTAPATAADTALFLAPADTVDDTGDGSSDDFAPAGVQRPLEGRARISPASADELFKIGAVYTPPPDFDQAAQVLGEHRLVHLVGPDHAGKFAMAHALARQQRQVNTSLRILTLRCAEDVSILDVLEDEERPPDYSILIIRDAFATPGLQRHDFRAAWGPLHSTLDNNDQYLILTTDSESPADAPTGWQQTVNVPALPAALYPALLDKHFAYYSIPESWWSSAAEVALSSLEHPYQFDLFATRLQRLEARPRQAQLEVIVRDMKDSALSVRVWFDGLNPNQRYFAMLASLLSSFSLDDLWQQYEKLYKFLKDREIRLDPPLNYGREDLLESIQARRTEFGTVEFNSPIFAHGALDQAQYNYREPFRLLLPKFAEAIESTVSDSAAPARRRAARDRRQALTTAIGLLGQADLRWVQPILLRLALYAEQNLQGQEKARAELEVRVAAAAVLLRICDKEKQQQPVANLLAGWARDGRPRVRWTAAAAYSKLPRSMVAGALKPLGKLAADNDFVRGEAAFALEQLFARAPDDVIAALNAYLADGNPTVARTVRMVVGAVSKDDRIQAAYFREAVRQDAFWPLLDNVIRRGSVEQAKFGLSLLRSWLVRADNGRQSEALEEKMLATAKMLGQQRHDLFKSTLSNWLEGAEPMSPLYVSAANLAREMVYIQPMIEIDESDLVEADILVIDIDPGPTPSLLPPTPDPIGIVWLDGQ